jgi:hypothetical protein
MDITGIVRQDAAEQCRELLAICVSRSSAIDKPANKADNRWPHTKVCGTVNIGLPSKMFGNPKHARRICGIS